MGGKRRRWPRRMLRSRTLFDGEQRQTIESQRGLIREMLKDSPQMAALKGKLARDGGKRFQEKASVETEKKGGGSGGPTTGKKGLEKKGKRPGKSAHAMKEVPGK